MIILLHKIKISTCLLLLFVPSFTDINIRLKKSVLLCNTYLLIIKLRMQMLVINIYHG